MSTRTRHVHPWLFMVLIIPFGVVSGYVTVTLGYQLKQAGVPVAEVTALIAFGLLPQFWKFFWAPVVDTTFNQKLWYVVSAVVSAAGIAAMGCFPPTEAGLKALSAVVFLTNLATTTLGMAVESLLAYSTPDDVKGHASGWYQAGNLGGSGIGGGLGLVLVQQFPAPWMASGTVAALCLLCGMVLVAVPSPGRTLQTGAISTRIKATFKDLWQVARNRHSVLAFILCFLPIGTGAITFSAIADEWSASANTVALVTGTLGGLISAVGCVAGGWVCDRMDRKKAYVLFGIIQIICSLAMALLARTQTMFVLWVLLYTFATGLSYAAFSAFVLEIIGKGAAATKYNALASLSNIPIWYMTILEGRAHDRWNSAGMFYTEAALAVGSAIIFLGLAKIFVPRRKAVEAEPAEPAAV